MAIHHARSHLYHIADGRLIMPADRRITVQVQGEGFRDPDRQGEYVPGEVVDYPVWASRRDVGQERKIERQGTRDETSRDWRIRWNSKIASTLRPD